MKNAILFYSTANGNLKNRFRDEIIDVLYREKNWLNMSKSRRGLLGMSKSGRGLF